VGYVFVEASASHQTNGFPGGVLEQVGAGDQRAAKFNNVGSQNVVNQSSLRLGGFAALSEKTSLDVELVLGKKDSAFSQPYYDTTDSFNTTYGFVTGAGLNKVQGDELSFSPKFRTEFANGASLIYGYDVSRSTQDGANTYSPLAQQFILANQGPYQYQGNIVSDQQSVALLNQSLYLISRIPLNETWDLSLGARRQLQNYDANDLNKSSGTQASAGTFDANAHEAALSAKLSDSSRAYFRVNQSYRFANTDEYWGFDANSNRVFSGELRPQITQAYEFGYDLKTALQQFTVMLAQSTTQHEIRYNPSLYRNSNLDDEVDRTSLLATWALQVLDKSRLMMGARMQRAKFANGSYAGQALGLVPNAIYNLGWMQDLEGRNRIGLQAVHVSKQNYDADPSVAATLNRMPAYTTVDAFWTRSYGQLETRLTVKNLTGKRYATYGGYGFVSTPGGGGASSYYHFPSDPRALMLSVNYRF
jgi:iron complex outermembrane receptor protein